MFLGSDCCFLVLVVEYDVGDFDGELVLSFAYGDEVSFFHPVDEFVYVFFFGSHAVEELS